jgi:type III pantothenate kinase
MILVDVGNTSAHFAVERKGEIVKTFRILTSDAFRENIAKALSGYPGVDVLVCSVVPAVTKIFKSLDNIGNNIYIAGDNLKIPIKSRYNKKQIGMDRLTGAFAASKLRPQSRIVIDFGTAITFDFLSPRGEYLGGFILPGMGSSLRVLSQCALLPDKIKLKKTRRLIPGNTADSISKGIEEGYSAMINAMAAKYKKILRLPSRHKIIITGGDGGFLMPRLNFPYSYRPFLVFEGLILLQDSPASPKPY